jgi:ABC-2 type transport system permease protein
MRNITAVMNRDLLALFFSPVAYIVIAGFLLITGVLARNTFEPGGQATLRAVFDFAPYILAIIIPAISMRAISEEYRSGTIESLMTTPISDSEMVIGKFLAALIFYLVMLGTTLIYLVLMMVYGSPDIGAAVASYIGLILLGMSFVAIGVFASSTTSNQIVAWMTAAVPLILIVWFADFMGQQAEGWVRQFVRSVNIRLMVDQFNRGLITTEGVVFFLGTTLLFVFLAIKVVESKRWR